MKDNWLIKWKYETLHVIWYHLYNLKNVENPHTEVLLLVKLSGLERVFLNNTEAYFSRTKWNSYDGLFLRK